MIKYQIYSASYKRAKIAITHRYLPEVIYVVSEREAEDYKKLHDKVWAVPNEVQGNLARVWNYILDNAKEDNVILMDDDVKRFGRWNDTVKKKMKAEDVRNMIEQGILMAEDLDVRYWGVNCISDKGAFMEHSPFGFRHYIGGPFQGHRMNPLRYDEGLYLKEDYDMTLQVLNKFRRNLRMNMYHYECAQNTIRGGVAAYRNVEREMEQNKKLQKKWGDKIVTFDTRNRSNKKKNYDINPILRIPIGKG